MFMLLLLVYSLMNHLALKVKMLSREHYAMTTAAEYFPCYKEIEIQKTPPLPLMTPTPRWWPPPHPTWMMFPMELKPHQPQPKLGRFLKKVCKKIVIITKLYFNFTYYTVVYESRFLKMLQAGGVLMYYDNVHVDPYYYYYCSSLQQQKLVWLRKTNATIVISGLSLQRNKSQNVCN